MVIINTIKDMNESIQLFNDKIFLLKHFPSLIQKVSQFQWCFIDNYNFIKFSWAYSSKIKA